MKKAHDNLVWIDLEMTGLDPLADHILEVATIVTAPDLEVIAEGPVLAIHHPEEILTAMDEWNADHHGRSGLIKRVRSSSYDYRRAELETLAFLKQWVPEGVSPMCGNSIHHDRHFLSRLMPELEAFFHYRILDVSTIKELAHRWAPKLAAGFKKRHCHLALDDIRESIEELRYYRENFFDS
ncbi:oligoribonuclease [Desulfogranum mediterraneum]|uniref:oligoribonuclease n=1 Tax=Desulfogranum mediterraneum TaxID=160661 RepID=UPI0003F5D366|nr:oligoribonuclease [Desulfogranum mediterraneum]